VSISPSQLVVSHKRARYSNRKSNCRNSPESPIYVPIRPGRDQTIPHISPISYSKRQVGQHTRIKIPSSASNLSDCRRRGWKEEWRRLFSAGFKESAPVVTADESPSYFSSTVRDDEVAHRIMSFIDPQASFFFFESVAVVSHFQQVGSAFGINDCKRISLPSLLCKMQRPTLSLCKLKVLISAK
jgi:hypothetical protein